MDIYKVLTRMVFITMLCIGGFSTTTITGCQKVPGTVDSGNNAKDPAEITGLTASATQVNLTDSIRLTATLNPELTPNVSGHLIMKVLKNGNVITTRNGEDGTLQTSGTNYFYGTIDFKGLTGLGLKSGDNIVIQAQLELNSQPSGATTKLSNTREVSLSIIGTPGVNNPPDITDIIVNVDDIKVGDRVDVSATVGTMSSNNYVNEVHIRFGGQDQVAYTTSSGEDISGQTFTRTFQASKSGINIVNAQNMIPGTETLPEDVKSRAGKTKSISVDVAPKATATNSLNTTGSTTTNTTNTTNSTTSTNIGCGPGQTVPVGGCVTTNTNSTGTTGTVGSTTSTTGSTTTATATVGCNAGQIIPVGGCSTSTTGTTGSTSGTTTGSNNSTGTTGNTSGSTSGTTGTTGSTGSNNTTVTEPYDLKVNADGTEWSFRIDGTSLKGVIGSLGTSLATTAKFGYDGHWSDSTAATATMISTSADGKWVVVKFASLSGKQGNIWFTANGTNYWGNLMTRVTTSASIVNDPGNADAKQIKF